MKTLLNNNREISNEFVPYFIAEVNTSHFGDIEKAKKLIDAVKEAGADCAKFQHFEAEKIVSDFGNLNLCVFSSGTYDPKLEQEINIKQNKFVMETNFFGVLYCIKTVESYFKNKRDGHISIVSSIAAYRGLPNSSGYGPSKAALTNLTESLYFDFKKHNVRISLVSPGFIKTPLTDKNEFAMPFIKSPEFAAEKMFNGLTKSKAFEIHFPKALTILLKIFRVLPYKIYLFLIDKGVKR